jgi:hypothetical protein
VAQSPSRLSSNESGALKETLKPIARKRAPVHGCLSPILLEKWRAIQDKTTNTYVVDIEHDFHDDATTSGTGFDRRLPR